MDEQTAELLRRDYMECASCDIKVGTPTLCGACLHNRSLVSGLKERVRQHESKQEGLTFAKHFEQLMKLQKEHACFRNKHPLEWWAFVTEEVGELAREVIRHTRYKAMHGLFPMDATEVTREVYDIIFNLVGLANALEIQAQDLEEGARDKAHLNLHRRYPTH